MSHKYSLDEIDRMRAALWRKYAPPLSPKIDEHAAWDKAHRPFYPNLGAKWYSITGSEKDDGVYFPGGTMNVEEELRTLMIGGVRPDELEAKYPVGPNPAVGGSAVVTVPWDSAVDYNPQLAEFLNGEEPAVIKGGLVGEADRRS